MRHPRQQSRLKAAEPEKRVGATSLKRLSEQAAESLDHEILRYKLSNYHRL